VVAVIASGNAPNSYTLTVDRPTGVEAGDLLVAMVSSDGDNITLGAPGGFVDLGNVTGYNRTARVWYKVATNAEPATYTFTSSSGNAYRVAMARVTGAPSSNPIAAPLAWNGANGSTTSLSVPQRTAPTGGALQLALVSYAAAGDITLNLPSGWSTPHPRTANNMALIAGRAVAAGTTAASTFTLTSSPYNHVIGSLLIASGQVVSIARSITPNRDLVRGPFTKILGGSITAAGDSLRQRVVVRLFSRSIGGTGSTDDNFTDAFTDSFATAGGTASTLSATLAKVPVKTFDRSIVTYGGYAKVTVKVLEASIAITGTSRRVIIRVFRATIAPVATFVNSNIGRLFGTPGIVDITVRLAGEIRARVRRR